MGTTSFAYSAPEQVTYDTVYSQLSLEYGFEIREATPEEMELFGFNQSIHTFNQGNVSMETEKEALRALIDKNIATSEQAEKLAAKAGTPDIVIEVTSDHFIPKVS